MLHVFQVWDPLVPRDNNYWVIWQTGIKFAAGIKAANKSPGRFSAITGVLNHRGIDKAVYVKDTVA